MVPQSSLSLTYNVLLIKINRTQQKLQMKNEKLENIRYDKRHVYCTTCF